MAAPPHKQTHIEDCPHFETPAAVDSKRAPQFDKVICRSRCGCTCCTSRCNEDARAADAEKHHHASAAPEADRCDISDTESIYSASIDGQEGAERQVQLENFGWVAVHIIQRGFERQGIRIHFVRDHAECRECARICNCYRETAGPVSPEDSMPVETGSVPPSMTVSQVSVASSASRLSSVDFAGIGDHFEAPYEYAHELDI